MYLNARLQYEYVVSRTCLGQGLAGRRRVGSVTVPELRFKRVWLEKIG